MGAAKSLQVKKDIFAVKAGLSNQLDELKALQRKVTEQQATSEIVEAMELRLLAKIEGVPAAAAEKITSASAKSDAKTSTKSSSPRGGLWSPR